MQRSPRRASEHGIVKEIGRKILILPPVILVRHWLAGNPDEVKWKWLSGPPSISDRVCIFVTCPDENGIPERAVVHGRRWHGSGYSVVFAVAADSLELREAPDFGHVLIRENKGYDFGAWAEVIRALPWLRDAECLVTTNDSVYGPGNGFEAMLDKVERSDADVVGLTESYVFQWHLQSYLLFFKRAALQHPAFWTFWRNIRIGGRKHVIDSYELQLAGRLKKYGLRVQALFPATSRHNPTLFWRELIAQGFPYVKRRMLQGLDASEWGEVLAGYGFDLGVIERDRRGRFDKGKCV